ncbi:Reticulocyte-binding protein 2-like [Gracilariopsis chorda]|uniref:Reticulocyte-binding protein 2-like n=1 Tax=Gracilariopsis chorda TaxID=448386 RepID=A0A2V3ISJ7_9FLOR|nr:Reticulocyte-binding protein 2-like [Gracilariopsis chorda]|eukprot:PXF45091.1 Reticulocyte-binding protein 2-like [Gracilariopsis chorda]
MSRTASQTNPTSLRGLEEDSSTDQLQQPEGKPIDERNRRHSRTHRKSPSDGKREANTNPDMTDMDKFCEPDSQALRKRPRLTNPKDGACPENIVSLKVDSEDVNTFGSAHSQEPVERKLKVQRSPHFKDSQRIQTHRSQIEEEESDEAQDRVQVQDAVLDDNEVLSSNIQSFTDRKNITPESIQARPSIEATLVGPKPNSLPNYAEIKSTGDSVLGSSVNTIAKPETSPKFPVPKETRTASKRIVVDRDGKVDQESLGILSKIAANAVNTTLEREKPRREPPPEQSQTPRTTKLFNPNSNIYALPRPSASSSVQRYTASSRSSMLSHTPGAQLPFKPVSNETSFGEKLASLNERFELLKKSQPDESRPGNYRSDEELNITTGLRTAEDHRNEMASVQRRVLTFAETDERPLAQHGMKTEPVREKQRTRFNAKPKSALRAKVEEIMTGKSNNLVSTPTASSAATIPSFSHSVLPTYGKSKSLLGSLKPETLDEPYSTGQPASQLEPEKDFANGIGDGPGNISVPAEQQTANNLPALRIPAARHSSHTTRESTSEDKHQEQSVLPTANEKVVDRGVSTETREFEEAESQDKKAPLGNLMTSLTSFIPGACSFLGSRPVRDRSEEESEAEATAKRQKLDMERREAELQARREAQRLLKQKETEEKQRRAERRRMLLARAEKEKEEERRRKEERRLKKKLEEEELRKKRKQEEDRKREERRRQVLEKRAQNQAKQKRTKKGLEAGGVRKIVKDGSSKVASTQMGGVEQGHGEEVVDLSVGGEKGTGGPLQTPVRKKVDSNTGPSTYMMTPAQETVLEHSDEEEERRKHKQIPRWAQGRKLSTAARAQPDPDEVFVNVPTCDLREVFGNARRFRARTSSANWTKDRVTSQEMMRFRKEQAAFNDEKG